MTADHAWIIYFVIPAQAGIQWHSVLTCKFHWTPACAGVTSLMILTAFICVYLCASVAKTALNTTNINMCNFAHD